MDYNEKLKAEARKFGYSTVQELARDRALVKRELRRLGVKGWANEDNFSHLQAVLRKAIRK